MSAGVISYLLIMMSFPDLGQILFSLLFSESTRHYLEQTSQPIDTLIRDTEKNKNGNAQGKRAKYVFYLYSNADKASLKNCYNEEECINVSCELENGIMMRCFVY